MDFDYPTDIPDASAGDFSEPVGDVTGDFSDPADGSAGDFSETADVGLQDTQQEIDDTLNWDDSVADSDGPLSDETDSGDTTDSNDVPPDDPNAIPGHPKPEGPERLPNEEEQPEGEPTYPGNPERGG